MSARHRALRSASRYLSTTSTPASSDGALFPTSPAPIAQRGSGTLGGSTSLYFLPKVLLPHQEEALRAREEEIRRTIDDEEDQLERDQREAREKARENAEKMEELEAKVRGLRESKARGGERGGERTRDELRRERERPSARDRDREHERESERESERKRSETPEQPPPRARADDEMEVEY